MQDHVHKLNTSLSQDAFLNKLRILSSKYINSPEYILNTPECIFMKKKKNLKQTAVFLNEIII